MNIPMNADMLQTLANGSSTPCVTISLNTHRTFPDNGQDAILLKNLCREAETRLLAEFDKKDIAPLLSKLTTVQTSVDHNYNLDSLHIYLSNEVEHVFKLSHPAQANQVQIGDTFALRPLINAYTRQQEYLVMLLSQSGVNLYSAQNENITEEYVGEGFPFGENPHFTTEPQKRSEPQAADNLVREFLNKVDKALVKVHHETGLRCVVVCTEDNYSRLMQVADKPAAYYGYAPIDYNHTAGHQIAAQAWSLVAAWQSERELNLIEEMQTAVSAGKVLTDLQEIYRAVKEGRGDLLIVHQAYAQPVRITDDSSFELVQDVTEPGVTDDITGALAWEVLSRKGRVLFTAKNEIQSLGSLALKVRY